MYTAEDFRCAYDDYAQFNKELYDRMGPMGGLTGILGFGKRPGNDPGHMKFLTEMESALKKTVQEKPDAETAEAIMDVIFYARNEYADMQVSPYVFIAVEGMSRGLIPFLTQKKAAQLYESYRQLPKNLRVPVMKQVLAALKKAAMQ